MTSFSPRKRRTTRPSTRPSTPTDGRTRRSLRRLAITLVLAGATFATAARAEDPFSHLKVRDPKAEWQRLSKGAPRPAPRAEPAPVRREIPEDAKLLPEQVAEGIPELTAADNAGMPAMFAAQFQPQPNPSYLDPIRDPKELKKLRDIRPYFDYEPDGALADQCQNLCPRPGHCPDCLRKRPEDLLPGEIGCPECPEEVILSREMYVPRSLPPIDYRWEASNLFYKPLYFEDVALERYGHTRHHLIQPVFSVGKMTGQMLFLPYQLSLCPPWRCRSPLGYHRPGECVPYKYYQVPLDAQAAAVQAGAVAGAYYLFAP